MKAIMKTVKQSGGDDKSKQKGKHKAAKNEPTTPTSLFVNVPHICVRKRSTTSTSSSQTTNAVESDEIQKQGLHAGLQSQEGKNEKTKRGKGTNVSMPSSSSGHTVAGGQPVQRHSIPMSSSISLTISSTETLPEAHHQYIRNVCYRESLDPLKKYQKQKKKDFCVENWIIGIGFAIIVIIFMFLYYWPPFNEWVSQLLPR